MSYYKLKAHMGEGHMIKIVEYAISDEYAVGCMVCNEVLVLFQKPETLEAKAQSDRKQEPILVLERHKIMFTRYLADDMEVLGRCDIESFQAKARRQILAEWHEAAVDNREPAMLWLDEPVTLLPTGEYEIEGVVHLPVGVDVVDFVQGLYDRFGLSGSFVFPLLDPA